MDDEKRHGMPYEEVMQVGLFETSAIKVEEFAQRVAKFNHRRMSNVVLDVESHDKGDAAVNAPHFKLRLTFPNHEVQEAFWME
jgi:hypothetical protein